MPENPLKRILGLNVSNEVIAPGEQYIILTLVSACGVSIGDSTSSKREVKSAD